MDSDDYRKRAEECDRMARRAGTSYLRESFEEAARQWRLLVDQMELVRSFRRGAP